MRAETITRRGSGRARVSMRNRPTPSIVCGVDESRASREALQIARRLGDRLGLRLVLAHVQPLPLVVGYPEVAYASRARDLETGGRAGHALLEEAARTAGLGADVLRRVEFGEPASGLVAVAEDENANLIVVGSGREGAWSAALRGSVSAGLPSKATRPVLVVPVGVARVEG